MAGSNTIGKVCAAKSSIMLMAVVLGDAVREFAGECGIEFADDKSAVIDHLNYDLNDNGKVKSE